MCHCKVTDKVFFLTKKRNEKYIMCFILKSCCKALVINDNQKNGMMR